MNANDAHILNLVKAAYLRICPETALVWIWHSRRRHWLEKKPDQHPKSGRFRFRFDVGEKKRTTIYRNRIIWIATHKRLPEGNIDHKDLNRLNDLPDNLQEMSIVESNKQGYAVQLARRLEETENFFRYCVRYGVPPPDGTDLYMLELLL